MPGWSNSDNKFGLSPYIVGTVLGDGCNYTSIQTALNDIAAGPGLGVIYIRAGTYVGSLAIAAGQGIHLIGAQATSNNAAVLIQGTITIGAGSGCGFENLLIGFTAANALNMTNSANLNCDDCHFFSTGTVAVVVNNATATLTMHDCIVQTAAVNDAFQNFSSTTCVFEDTEFLASSGGAMSLVGASRTEFNKCSFDSSAVLGGTATGTFRYCTHTFAAGEAYAIGAGTTVNAYHNTINTIDGSGFWATGTGTLNYADIALLANRPIDPGLTAVPQDWKPYGTAGTTVTAVRGTAGYDSADFTVTNGFVELTGGIPGSFPTDSGTATPAAGVLNILGGPGVTTSAVGNTVTINSVVYTDQGGSTTVGRDTGSFATGAGTITLTLPAGATQGELVELALNGATTLIATANAGQTIRVGSVVSSVAGTATSTAQGDTLVLRFKAATSQWHAISVVGNFVIA